MFLDNFWFVLEDLAALVSASYQNNHVYRPSVLLGMNCINENCKERKQNCVNVERNIHYCIALIGISFHELGKRKVNKCVMREECESSLDLPRAIGATIWKLPRRSGHCLHLTLINDQQCVPDYSNKNNNRKKTDFASPRNSSIFG